MIMAALVLVGMATVLLTPEPRAGRGGRAPSATGSGAAALAAIAIAAGLVFLAVKFLLFAPFDLPAWIPNVTAILAAAITPVAIVLALPAPAASSAGLAGSYADMRQWLSGAVVDPFAEFINRSGLKVALLILAFILLYKFGDAIAGVMANPFYVRIGFTNEEIASVSKVFGLIATLVGVFLGGLLVARVGIHMGLLAGGILQMLSNLMFAAQAAIGHDVSFLMLTIGFENLAGGVGSAAFVAYLSGLCNVAFTGTQYALFSSLAAIGRTVLSAPGGLLAENMGWVSYFLLSTVVALPGLLLLLWMMKRFPAAGRPAAQPAE
jgi:PAT family beta-lactamase induction signal transducer AmpG